MNGLTLAVIVNNDVAAIDLLLRDVLDLCDELIVIDTGSSDDTLRVAEALGARFYYFAPLGDEADIRNFAREKCTGNWILFLDPYDRLTSLSKEAFTAEFERVKDNPNIDVVCVHVRSNFTSDLSTSFQTSEYRQTIVRNLDSIRWNGVVAPQVNVESELVYLPEHVWIEQRITTEKRSERSINDLSSLQKAIANGDQTGNTLIRFASELMRHGRSIEADEYFERATYADLKEFERYELLVAMSLCSKELGEMDQCRLSLGKALALDSSRAEAFIQLGSLHFEQSEWERARPFFRAASIAERPIMTPGSFDETAYTWLAWDYLSVCASEMGKLDDALDYTFRALPGNPERERLMKNMRLILDRQRSLKSS